MTRVALREESDKEKVSGHQSQIRGGLFKVIDDMNNENGDGAGRDAEGGVCVVVCEVNEVGQFMLRELLENGESRTHRQVLVRPPSQAPARAAQRTAADPGEGRVRGRLCARTGSSSSSRWTRASRSRHLGRPPPALSTRALHPCTPACQPLPAAHPPGPPRVQAMTLSRAHDFVAC